MPNQTQDRLPDSPYAKPLTGWRRWLPVYIYKKRSGWKLQTSLPLLTGWILIGVIVGYLAAGTALFLNDRHRLKLTGISWFDRVYPPNWQDYREARGRSYIELAQKSLRQGEFSKAFHQLRAGLARHPEHQEGRMLLGEMFGAAGRSDLAQSTLLSGIEFHFADINYLQSTIRFLFSKQQDHEVIQLAKEVLPKLPPDSPELRFLALSLASALYYRGQFDQAEDVLKTYGLSSSPDGRLLTAKIEWDRGFPELALALIDQLAVEFPLNDQIYRTQVRWLIEQGDPDKARRASLLRRIRFPDQPQPRIDLLYAYHEANDTGALMGEANALLTDFGEDYGVVLQVGDFAANTGRPDLAQRILDHAAKLDMPQEGPSLMLVEAMIVSQRYEEALAAARHILDQNPEWEEQMAPIFNGLQAICFFALGDREDASLFLDSYLGLKQVRAENLVAVAERLLNVGADREARRVLAHAVSQDRLNQSALTRIIEFDLTAPDAPELPENIERLLAMRRASPELLRQAYDRLGEDRFLFVEDRNQLLDRLLESLRGKSGAEIVSSH